MKSITIPQTKYEEMLKRQRELSRQLAQLMSKLEILGSLEKFEKIAAWGRDFAKQKGVKPQDVLIDD